MPTPCDSILSGDRETEARQNNVAKKKEAKYQQKQVISNDHLNYFLIAIYTNAFRVIAESCNLINVSNCPFTIYIYLCI